MIYLLLGPDDFSKREFIDAVAKKHKLAVERVDSGDDPALRHLTEASLFAPAKIFVLIGLLSTFDLDKELERWSQGANRIILVEEKLDKRKSSTKELLKDKRITTKEFPIPEGKVLEKWLGDRAAALGGSIKPDAIALLVDLVGGGGSFGYGSTPSYSLWQIDGEIKKLLEYSAGKVIDRAVVAALVPQTAETEVWSIINAVADRQTGQAFQSMEQFFRTADGSDEKAKAIQLNAVLAEQFRNVVMIHSFAETGTPDSDILRLTGWKSGRLFVLKKIAKKFRSAQAMEFLKKLENLDLELKTGSVPPRVILDLIVAQL